MPLPGFIATFLVTRSVPVIASVVLHASVAAGVVVVASGHGAGANVAVPAAQVEIDLDATEPALLTPVPPEPVPPPSFAAKTRTDLAPSHTHPYPVDPAHDAHPHDPAHHHDEARAAPASRATAADPAPPPAPAPAPEDGAHEAAPALTATGPAIPRFTIATGSGAPLGVRVAANASGDSNANANANTGSAAGADDAIVAASSVQVGARLVQSVVAAYPAHARADEVEGDVAVEIVVDREGRVIEARVTRPAGHGFDEAALVAVRSYRFSPALREGRAVRVRMAWSVQFRLR